MAENEPTPQRPEDPDKTTRQPRPDDRRDRAEDPLVESPSATTSSERNKSGNAAWIIVGVVLLALALLASGIAGCTSAVISGALEGQISSQGGDLSGYLDDDGSPYGLGSGSLGSGSGTGTSSKSTYTTEQALALLQSGSINGDGIGLDATATSGAQQAAVDFSQRLVDADGRHTEEMQRHLRAAMSAASSDADTRTAELAAAKTEAEAAKAEVDGLAAPAASELAGSQAADVAEDLSDAKDSLAHRWEDIAKVIDMVTDPKQLTVEDLSDEDDLIRSDTDDASYYLAGAFGSSSTK